MSLLGPVRHLDADTLPEAPLSNRTPPYRSAGARCPGCGRSHWLIGRATAECGFCATALPLSHSKE